MIMNEDKILRMFFEPERWQYAISKGIDKDISKAQLYQLCKPEARLAMYNAIKERRYKICPPHTAKLTKEDGENFQERNRWFNEKVVAGMMKDYIEKLHKYVDG